MHDATDHDTQPRHTVHDIAAALGITRGRVHQIARAQGLGRKIGRDMLYSDADLVAMRARNTTPGPRPRRDLAAGDESNG